MSDWDIHFKYDYRFNGMMLQAENKGEISPVFTVALKDILDGIPAYEIRAALQPKHKTPDSIKGEDIQKSRVELLESVDWKGKICLDIGGYDGFAAEIAHRGGAKRAIVLDNHQYEHYGWEEKKYDGVEYICGDFMDWLPWDQYPMTRADPVPDVIVFFNVLYHLRNPWAALDHLRAILRPDGEMLLCTLFRYHDGAWMYVYDERECNKDDSTVYFGPSLEALERLLRHAGWSFERGALAYDRVLYRCRPVPDFIPTLAAEGYARS